MDDLGQLLRRSREQQGLSIKDAEAVTRIRARYLEGLEHDDYAVMPAPVYTRGFLRTYARFLGLDDDEVVEGYDRSQAATAFAPRARGKNQPVVSARAWRGPNVRTSVTAGLLVLIAVVLAYFFRQYGAFVASDNGAVVAVATPGPTRGTPSPLGAVIPTTEPPAVLLPAATATSAPPAPTFSPVPPTATQPPPPPTAPPATPTTAAPTPTVVTGVALTTSISQTSWMLVTVDGRTVFEGTFPPGTSRKWDAKQFITIRSGNAGGVQVNFNGQDQGLMGTPGQVVEKTWRAATASSSSPATASRSG